MSKQRDKLRPDVKGGMLIGRGDVIQVIDKGTPVKCVVLSCLAASDGDCLATLLVVEGSRKGERIETRLSATSEKAASLDSEPPL